MEWSEIDVSQKLAVWKIEGIVEWDAVIKLSISLLAVNHKT